jgi:hypothetical protein
MALSTVCFGALPLAAQLLVPDEPWAAVGAVLVGALVFLVVCLRWRAALALPSLRALRRRGPRLTPSAPAAPDPAAHRALTGGAQ